MVCLLISLLTSFSKAESIQVAIGGGDHSEPLIKFLKQKIFEKNGLDEQAAHRGNILYLGWPSRSPKDYLDDWTKNFNKNSKQGTYQFMASFEPPNRLPRKLKKAAKIKLLNQIRKADAIIISGGDQKRLMDSFDDEIMEALKLANRTAPLVTTSASTAALGEVMITGDFSPLGKGMGFISGFVPEQHYLVGQKHFVPNTHMKLAEGEDVVQREARVIRAMERSGLNRAMAVAEDGAIALVDHKTANVIGNRPTVFYELKGGKLLMHQMSLGQRFDLVNWIPVDKPNVSCFNLGLLFGG